MKILFGRKGEQITRTSRKLASEDLRNFCLTADVIKIIESRIMRRARPSVRHGRDYKRVKIFVGKPVEKNTTWGGLGIGFFLYSIQIILAKETGLVRTGTITIPIRTNGGVL
jgi:hypothetical protein